MIRGLNQDAEVYVKDLGRTGRVHRVRVTPTGVTLYGVRLHGEVHPDEKRKRTINYDHCDCYVTSDKLVPNFI